MQDVTCATSGSGSSGTGPVLAGGGARAHRAAAVGTADQADEERRVSVPRLAPQLMVNTLHDLTVQYFQVGAAKPHACVGT